MGVVERLDGVGRISRGSEELLGTVRYDIEFYERETDDRRGGTVTGGVRRMRGRIHIDLLQGARLIIYQEPLTLTLQDGRTLNFRLTNNETGEIVRAAGGGL